MGMNTGCFVPSVFPDLLHLAVLLHGDQSFYLIDEPFSRKSLAHRALIRNPAGTQWLTLPIRTEDRKKPLKDVRLDQSQPWNKHIMKVLMTSYGNSVYFDFYEPEIRADLEQAAGFKHLWDVIQFLNLRLFRYLELGNILSDKVMAVDTKTFNQTIKVQQKTQPVQLWIEPRGRYYRKLGNVGSASVSEPAFSLPVYHQHFTGFEPGCCLLDILFQYGPLTFQIFDQIQPAPAE